MQSQYIAHSAEAWGAPPSEAERPPLPPAAVPPEPEPAAPPVALPPDAPPALLPPPVPMAPPALVAPPVPVAPLEPPLEREASALLPASSLPDGFVESAEHEAAQIDRSIMGHRRHTTI